MIKFSPIQLNAIELFCKAASLGSFTAAAEALGITPAAVSRAVTRLEERLGVRLFARTTRKIRLTVDGKLYFEQCRQALEQIGEVERVITGNQEIPRGTLRISMPTTYGHFRVLPLLPLFLKSYPQVCIEIDISNRNIDFVDEGFDLAIRLGNHSDSRLVAHKLEDASVGVFASPQYLARAGTPVTLEELADHHCIQFNLPSTGRPMPWIFREGDKDIEYPFNSRIRCYEDVLACVTLARHGAGLFQIYHFIAEEYERNGDLVEVLKPYSGRTRKFSILYPHNRHLSSKVRSFVDFLRKNTGSMATGKQAMLANAERRGAGGPPKT